MMSEVDWQWILPKAPLMVAVFAAAWLGVSTTVGRRNAERQFPYHQVTFLLLLAWLSSVALDTVFNPPKKAIEAAVAEGFYKSQGVRVPEVREYTNAVWEAVGRSIEESQSEVAIISWYGIAQQEQTASTADLFKRINTRVKDRKRPNVVLRRVFWLPEHLEYIRKNAEEYNQTEALEIAYYDPRKHPEVPVLPCVIVDKKSVHFGFGYLGVPTKDEVDVFIADEKVAALYERYFTFIWTEAVRIKRQGAKVDMDLLTRLQQEYNTKKD
jgi:hypothetical protein